MSTLTMKTNTLSMDTFDSLREWDRLETETLYRIGAGPHNKAMFAVTPDGEGCLFYDTEAEALEQHGYQVETPAA